MISERMASMDPNKSQNKTRSKSFFVPICTYGDVEGVNMRRYERNCINCVCKNNHFNEFHHLSVDCFNIAWHQTSSLSWHVHWKCAILNFALSCGYRIHFICVCAFSNHSKRCRIKRRLEKLQPKEESAKENNLIGLDCERMFFFFFAAVRNLKWA